MLSRTPEEALRKWINELSAPYATASQTSFVWNGARQLLTKYDAQSTELEVLHKDNSGLAAACGRIELENSELRTKLSIETQQLTTALTKSQAQASMLEASAQREAALQCALSQAEGELLHASLECLLRPAPPPDQALSTRVTSLERRTEALEARQSPVPTVQATQVASPRWKPTHGQDYWSINTSGQINHRTNFNQSLTEEEFVRGNVFRTKYEAESAEEKRLVLQKLQDLADASGPVLSTWYEVMQHEFGWGVFDVRKSTPGAIRFKTCKSADHALQVLGPELEVLRP